MKFFLLFLLFIVCTCNAFSSEINANCKAITSVCYGISDSIPPANQEAVIPTPDLKASTTTPSTTESTSSESKFAEKYKSIKEETNSEFAAKIEFTNEKVFLWKSEWDSLGKFHGTFKDTTFIKIERISMFLKDGHIIDFTVFTDDKKSYKLDYDPYISTVKFNVNKLDEVIKYGRVYIMWDKYTSYYILVSDFLRYIKHVPFNLFPDDDRIDLNIVDKVKLLNLKSINGLVDVKIFSDLLGLLDNEPNGIVQTQLSTKFFLHDGFSDSTSFFTSIEPMLTYSKIEKQNNVSNVDSNILNRQGILQRAWLKYGLTLNVFKKQFSSFDNNVFFNVGYLGLISKIVNTKDTSTVRDTSNFFTNSFFGTLGFNLNLNENFGVELSDKILLESVSNPLNYQNADLRYVNNVNVSLFYRGDYKSKNYLYFKFSRYDVMSGDMLKQNPIINFQIGYSINVTSLF